MAMLVSGQKRRDVQALRALAVGAVVLYHLPPAYNFEGGFIGVDIFFVISGYVITRSLRRDLEEVDSLWVLWTHFMRRRVQRLLSPLLLAVGATVILSFVFAPARDLEQMKWAARASVAFGTNAYFLQRFDSYWNPEVLRSPFLHLWSLGVEFQIYLIWPVIGFLATRFFKRRFALLLGIISCVSLVFFVYFLSVRHSEILSLNPRGVAFYSPLARLWQIGLGGVVAITAQESTRLNDLVGARQSIIRWLGLGLIALGLVRSTQVGSLSPWVLSACCGTAMLLFCEEPKGRVLRSSIGQALEWMGDRSYSIYLWHWPLLVVALWLSPGNLRWSACAVLLSLILANWSYWKLEARRRPTSGWKRKIFVLAVVVLAWTLGPASNTDWYRNGAVAAMGASLLPEAAVSGREMTDAVQLCREIFAGIECNNYGLDQPQIAIIGDSLGYRSLPAVQYLARRRNLNTSMMWTGG